MIRLSRVWVLVLLLTGCATPASIRRNFQQVNYNDGISRREAIIIAQDHLLQHELKGAYVYIDPTAFKEGAFWRVAFGCTFLTCLKTPQEATFVAHVDRQTGQVLNAGTASIWENPIEPFIETFSLFGLGQKDPPIFVLLGVAAGYHKTYRRWPEDVEDLMRMLSSEQKLSNQEAFRDIVLSINEDGHLVFTYGFAINPSKYALRSKRAIVLRPTEDPEKYAFRFLNTGFKLPPLTEQEWEFKVTATEFTSAPVPEPIRVQQDNRTP